MKLGTKIISGALLIMTAGVSVVGAHAFGAGEMKIFPGKAFDQEERVQIVKYIEEGDFSAWQQLMKDNNMDRVLEKVTAEQFAKMGELEKALKAGDKDKIRKLVKELKGMGAPVGQPFMKKKFVMKMKGDKFEGLSKLSDEAKDQLKAAHQAGDRGLVKKILEENGFNPPMAEMGKMMRVKRGNK